MNLAELLLSSGASAAPAVLHQDCVVTYAELRERVRRLAAALIARGYAKGDRIGIVAENNPFFVMAYLGVIRAGLVAVPLPTDFSAASFAQIVAATRLSAVLASKRCVARVQSWTQEFSLPLLAEGQEGDSNDGQSRPIPEIAPDRDLAALMFTSGSTGQPKGVMITHRNIECNTRDIVAYLNLTPADRVMVVLPFHYCFGLSLLHSHLLAGGTLVLNNDFRLFPESTLLEMRQKQCTGLAGVPSTYQMLLQKTRFTALTFPALRWFQQAGGKLPDRHIQEIRAAFPVVKYFLMYGQTEATARLSYLPPSRIEDKCGSVGKGLPSTALEVLKPDGRPVTPGSEETGEIVAVGDNIALGYWDDPVESAKFFRGGKLYTGDIARVDRDGFIYIVERERDMIKSGGNRVGPKEVEEVIAEIPGVIEVAVLGVPDDLRGEAIKAFVVPSGKLKLRPEDIKAHCYKRLPAFKTPEEVIFLETMPHSSAGKILKLRLRELLAHRQSAASDQTFCLVDTP